MLLEKAVRTDAFSAFLFKYKVQFEDSKRKVEYYTDISILSENISERFQWIALKFEHSSRLE